MRLTLAIVAAVLALDFASAAAVANTIASLDGQLWSAIAAALGH